jgi:AmiR/NasT family two-component response regulator
VTQQENGRASFDLDHARREVAELHTALETRHSIGLAQGLLMARYGLSTEQSFAYLQRRSQDGNVKLRLLADEVVSQWHDAGCRFDEFDPAGDELTDDEAS